jgi:hypothetical protein
LRHLADCVRSQRGLNLLRSHWLILASPNPRLSHFTQSALLELLSQTGNTARLILQHLHNG